NHQALDAVFANVAGASRIDLNRRWATPVSQGYGTATSFPFADAMQRDPLSLAADGELENGTASLRDMPKIFYTNTGVEYWGGARAAALIHTTPDGARDVPVPQNVRIYFNAGAQHGPGAFPPVASMGQALGNPTDYRLTMRALLMSMEEWMHGAVSPPPSRYPRIDDGTLVRVSGISFPALPDAVTLRTLTGGRRVKSPFLPDGAAAGALLPLLVPQVDADGNELAGIRLPEVAVPLATYTGWNFRGAQAGASDELFPLLGSYLPFATTKAARLLTGDPRRSVAERYESKVRYLARVRDAADELVRSRYLRAEDVDRVMQRAADHWELRAH
ncbi:MAG: alpha/beta hydrolase domain-containing protein, partial [bacterium]